jgi:hypothetical protein
MGTLELVASAIALLGVHRQAPVGLRPVVAAASAHTVKEATAAVI